MLALGYQRYQVIGISMGGLIAQEVALRFSQHVESLTLMCTLSGGNEFVPLPLLEVDELLKFYALPPQRAAELAIRATSCRPEMYESLIQLRLQHQAPVEEILKQKLAVDEYLRKE